MLVKDSAKRDLTAGITLILVFVIWTLLILHVDVQPVGVNKTNVGFSTLNVWFHRLTGVHLTIYTITDWLGLVPILVCMCFGAVGFVQLIRRRKLFKVDHDILLLGLFYIFVIIGYLVFEMIPINYRPIPIDGHMEASYPSSTTLLVLSVMPTLKHQVDRRVTSISLRKATTAFVILFTSFMVIGRTVAGVHWLTDILGSVFLSAGLFLLYRSAVKMLDRKTGEIDESEEKYENTGSERES